VNPLRRVPGVLAVTVLVSLAAWGAGLDVSAPPPLAFEIQMPWRSDLEFLARRDFHLTVFTMLVISTSKALASASVLGRHARSGVVDFDRDLGAFGVGNIGCGLVGGLPLSANLGGSGILIQAGARTALANGLQALWILLAIVFLPAVFTSIPEEVTVGITLFSVLKLLSLERIQKLRAVGRAEWHTFGWVAVVAAFVGVNEAMILGLGVSVIRMALVFSSSLRIHCEPRDAVAQAVRVRLAGPLTVLALPQLYETLTQFPRGTTVDVDTSELSYCDAGCLAKLTELERAVERSGGLLIVDQDNLAILARRDHAAPA
jgi:MFS superfamily sulfate permease-like transporter